jgi:prevent-host-death family protein
VHPSFHRISCQLCKTCDVESVSAQELRDHWMGYREAAYREGRTFVVTYFDTPVAVVLSPVVWRRGLARVSHGDRCCEIGVRESRVSLRKLLDRARDGAHTVITKHGDENAVIVPYAWAREALPELVGGASVEVVAERDGG